MRKPIISAYLLAQLLLTAQAQDYQQFEDQKLKASDARFFSYFGVSMDIEHEISVIGAMYHTHSGETDAGAAYVFEKNAENVWQETAFLTASDAAGSDTFGRSTAISGNTILIGSSFGQTTINENHGKAYVFEKINDNWIETQIIDYTGDQLFPMFGQVVDMNDQFLIIAAPSENNDFGISRGVVYVYTKTNNLWTFSQKLMPVEPSAGGDFGDVISLNNNLLVISSYLEQTEDGIQRGAVYIYSLDEKDTWQLDQRIKPESESNQYTYSGIATSGGQVILRRSIRDNPSDSTFFLDVYSKVNDIWQTTSSISPPNNEYIDGSILGLNSYGNNLLVSAVIDPDESPEFIVVHHYGQTAGQWQYKNSFLPSDPKADSGFGFGFAYTVSETDVLIGSYSENSIADESGAAYAYDIDFLFANGFE
ncbi:hypothetical protein OS175_13430 [Marinicella sp. S1101]|uniref:FG-GAP repeat protein n=1 Tax=Marinicella marina TaxID=2996016 RepID=UPI002260F170|nr:FG-GAP repeat protein [Marinicella marina]MCX7554876.1 hypothetical protein [Marinicella marina]MDJ1141534.1 hypothetical protein [Marinicella marina]